MFKLGGWRLETSTRGLFGLVDELFVLAFLFGPQREPMLGTHFAHGGRQLFKRKSPQWLRTPSPARSYASTSGTSSVTRRIAVGAGAVGSVSLVAAYFFWPDVSRSAPTYANVALSPTHFTPVTITATEQCLDPTTRLMTLTVPRESMPPPQDTLFAPIWSIFIKDDDIQVERPYTPLEGIDDQGRMRFWVKRYPKGEVGRWLHSKRVGDQIEIRGPLKTWAWQDQAWDEVVMVSQARIIPYITSRSNWP